MPARAKKGAALPADAVEPAVKQVNVHEAKTNLSRLLDDALAGHTVIIARRDKPLVKLVPVEPVLRRVFGRLKGKIAFDDRFFDPLPEDEVKAWEGE